MDTQHTVERVWTRPTKGGALEAQEALVLEAGQGVVGDHTLGGKRQVTLVFADDWQAATAQAGVELDPSARRANVLLSGGGALPLIGSSVRLGDARIEVLGETCPCSVMDAAAEGLKEALRPAGRGGVWGRIVEGGTVRPSDVLVVETSA